MSLDSGGLLVRTKSSDLMITERIEAIAK